MKSFKLLVSGAFVLALFAPVFIVSPARAQIVVEPEFLECFWVGNNEFPTGDCDIGLIKEVSVNGAAFVDANTSAEAANAAVGDTVTWRITVSNESTGDYTNPIYTVWISDILPTGFDLDSAVASDGSFSSNSWQLPLITEVGEGYFSNLDATLTLTTMATATGTFENVAAFSEYDGCGDACIGPFADDNSDNNSDSAWVSISGAPVVLADVTPQVLADTGIGTTASLVAGGLIVSTLGLLGYSRYSRKNS